MTRRTSDDDHRPDPGAPPPALQDLSRADIIALKQLIAWWQERSATLRAAQDGDRTLSRMTLYVEQRWQEAIRQMAAMDGSSIASVVNAAFQHFFEQHHL